MPASSSLQPFSEFRMLSYFSDRCVTTCMRVGLSHRKNGLPSALRLVDELERLVENLVVDRLHPLRVERSGILDLLLADLAPARLHGRIIDVGGPRVEHVARADGGQQVLRVVGMRRVFHRVEVIEVAEELVEAVHGRQEFVEIAQVVLAELTGGVAHRLECRRDGHRLRRHADGRASLAYRGQPVRIGSSPVMKLARPAVQLASA